MNPFTISLTILLPFFLLHLSTPLNTITTTRSLQDGNLLISDKQIFALGFFSPINSTNRYLGIWYYKVSEQTVVWVANRDDPIVDTNGVVSINEDNNLVVSQKTRPNPIWSTNMSTPFMNKSDNKVVAKLMDSGNLVLLFENDSTHEKFLWQSFDYPTDTMLPFMKLGFDRNTGFNRFLSSWKSKKDPGTGTCSFKINPTGFPQLFLYKGLVPWWRPGPWTGERLSGVPEMTSNYIFNISFINNVNELSIMYGVINESIITRMVVSESGIVNRFTWNNKNHQWIGFWYDPKEECDLYGKCGANSNCDPYNADEFACKCLPGFEPKSEQEWYLRDGSGGCVRNHRGSVCRNEEGFVKVERVRLPDSTVTITNMSMNLKECEQECLANCSCVAFTSADVRGGGTGCVAWHGDLIDTRTYSDVGQNLYVRVDSVVLAQYAKAKRPPLKTSVLAATLVSAAIALLLISFFLYCFVIKKRNTRRRNSNSSFGFNLSHFDNSLSGNKLDESTSSRELCFFSLSSIANATDNFSAANKLGEGGFGSVYKGKLNNGTEIAVKRLSKYSGQGVDEFKNEVTLIAKLQHRNLVRMIGCCIKDEEKMLIYEYLPNKSLDFFIFDERKRSILAWRKRFDIIVGIARGILYLHQDSRLRIIHRDLKASNVLLDAEMNPKISDFGMARIFGVNQNEANTNRVVGTYGYMSPEYAMEGLFSTKSDVYSFGVLLLEIVTGKKNSSFYHECPSSNLVGHVWELWMEGRAIEVVDSFMELEESCCVGEVLRCIQTGLLCVQEVPVERPTMSTVIFMLGNDASLPSPKQPAFIFKRSYNSSDPSTSTGFASSVNEVTVTMVDAR